MKAALFSNTIDRCVGYGNITYELSQALHAAGVDVTLVLPKSQQKLAQSLLLPFSTTCVLPEYVFRIFQRAGPGYFYPHRLKGFDLLHDLFAFPYCIPAALTAMRSGIPFITGAQGTHGVRPLTYIPERWLLKWCYGRARALVVPSAYTRDKIHEYAKRAYPIDIIHNGVHAERFQEPVDAEVQSVRARHPGKRLLLTVGGLWGRKGHDLVLRALPAVLKVHPDTVYLIVGDGNGRAELERLATECGVRENVEFVGRKSGSELVAHFQACDVYVHTPKVVDLKFEGFGIVYLEASACGKPIVATNAGGVPDAVVDGQTGIIVPQDDVDGIAAAIVRVLGDPALAKRLGDAGRTYASAHDWSAIARQYIAVYERALRR